MPVFPQLNTTAFSGHVIVNGVDLTGLDLSHGFSLSNSAGHIVINGMEFTAPDTMNALTLSPAAAVADTGSGNGGVEIRGIVVSGLDASSGPVLLDSSGTGAAHASSSVVVGDGSAMVGGAQELTALIAHPALGPELHLAFGPDWLFP